MNDSGVAFVSWLDRHRAAALIVFVATLLVTAGVLSRSFFDGRLAFPMTHDDVNFFISGIQHVTLFRTHGSFALVWDFIRQTLHAPLTVFQAMVAFQIFGFTDWAPYASNAVWLGIFFAFAAYLLRGCPAIVLIATLVCIASMPLSSTTIQSFVPEITCSLLTSIAAVLMVRLSAIDTPMRSQFWAGLCFGFAFLAHPTAFAFTGIAVLASVGVAFLRDVALAGNFKKLKVGVINSCVSVLLSIWLPALYMVPRFRYFGTYFYDAITNPVWKFNGTFTEHLVYYLFGTGGQTMFGHQLLAYAAIIGLGIVAAWRCRNHQLLARQLELLVLLVPFWMVPTLAPDKAPLFASTFAFTVAFMMVIALRSIYQALAGRQGVIAVSAISLLLLLAYRPAKIVIANTPQTLVERDLAFAAINRLKTVLVGNDTDYRGTKVYMTNIGAYATNILQYYLLKTDPTLDWAFDSKVLDPDPRDHIAFIHIWQPNFVIAGQRNNGLTYSPFAQPAEDSVFAAMWQDPDYMAIDSFYGQNGREVVVFQRRGSFAGWRPISGISGPSTSSNGARVSTGGTVYLQTFAARQVQAEVQIICTGLPGEKAAVFINRQRVVNLTFSPENGSASLRQPITLTAGPNDLVLQYAPNGEVQFERLLVIPHIEPHGTLDGAGSP
jgi:hypothetical protein